MANHHIFSAMIGPTPASQPQHPALQIESNNLPNHEDDVTEVHGFGQCECHPSPQLPPTPMSPRLLNPYFGMHPQLMFYDPVPRWPNTPPIPSFMSPQPVPRNIGGGPPYMSYTSFRRHQDTIRGRQARANLIFNKAHLAISTTPNNNPEARLLRLQDHPTAATLAIGILRLMEIETDQFSVTIKYGWWFDRNLEFVLGNETDYMFLLNRVAEFPGTAGSCVIPMCIKFGTIS